MDNPDQPLASDDRTLPAVDDQRMPRETASDLNQAADLRAVGAHEGVTGTKIDRIQHPVFVLAYLANLVLVTANATLFIFADWVFWLSEQTPGVSYSEELPGRIVRFGLLASICARSVLGMAIDYLGVRIVWAAMGVLALAGACVFLSLDQFSWLVYVGRMAVVIGIAGMFTCSAFHIQDCVAENRRTEFLALLGTSGFIGMIIGSQLTAWLEHWTGQDRTLCFQLIFTGVVVSMVAYVVLTQVCLQIGGTVPPAKEARPSLFRMMIDYWPGPIVLVAMTMGMLFTVPSLYLIRFTSSEGLGTIAPFWTTYAISAFVFRIRTSALSRRVGRYKLITIGLATQGIGLLMLVPVTDWWHLLPSALMCGFGHSLLFPSIVSLGSGTFPVRYRGSGTNLTLGCFDLGAAISAPLMGSLIDLPAFGGAGFRQMFAIAGVIPLTGAILWWWLHRGKVDAEITVRK